MSFIKPVYALGIMGGASIEEVGLSIIKTDGVDIYEFVKHSKIPYDFHLKDKLLKLFVENQEDLSLFDIETINKEITDFYIDISKSFIEDFSEKIDIIGLEGPVVYYNSKDRIVYQLGDAGKIATTMSINTVSNFHKSDMLAGGNGFPITSSYYAALTSKIEKPIVVVNVGIVSTVTWIGVHGEMMAFDAGPGNFAINEWVYKHGGMSEDYNGKLAITGVVDNKIVASMMRHKYFALCPPKSVMKSSFDEKLGHLEGLSLEDGAATVTSFVAEAIAYSISLYFPELSNKIIIGGQGAKNPTLVRFIKQKLLDFDVKTVTELGSNIDRIESGLPAFLAVRRINLLPISFPNTTCVSDPVTCGEVFDI